MKTLFSITLLGTSTLFSACTNNDPNPVAAETYQKTTVVYKEVAGVNQDLLSMDIYHPEVNTIERPIVVYVHGGAWAVGDKANNIDNKVDLFSSLGYLFVSVNYRLSPSTYSSDPNRIMFPTHNNDVADAVAWIYNNINLYGGNKNKIVLLGHSAGAHLVSLTGTSNTFLPDRGIQLNQIKGVASIDTEGYDVSAQCTQGNETYLNAFGSNPTQWLAASPIHQLSSTNAYPAFFVAKRGSANRINLANAFIAALNSVGVVVSEVNGSQYDHEGINDAIGAPGETTITEPLKDFLERCFQ
ncbi:MAG: alpha/beta hydrolase [Cytophagia bacterium]|nr:alpha/beta hydrolase [Cytophagia bacterium]